MPTGIYIRTKPPWNKNKKGCISKGSFKKGHLMSKGKNNPMYGVHRFGKSNPNWKNGRHNDGQGYILIYQPTHPFCNNKGYVYEHRLTMEKQIGRYLTKKERVHHINKIKDDNRIENLMVFRNNIYHIWFHREGSCNLKGIIFDGRKSQ